MRDSQEEDLDKTHDVKEGNGSEESWDVVSNDDRSDSQPQTQSQPQSQAQSQPQSVSLGNQIR